MFIRKQLLLDAQGESLFLWGARQTGKSTLLKQMYPNALWFDLLMADVYQRLITNPTLLRETILGNTDKKIVVVDDDETVLSIIGEILGSSDEFEIFEAGDGNSAISDLKNFALEDIKNFLIFFSSFL